TVASGSWDKTVRLWDLGTGKARGPALEGHTAYVSCLAISPNGKTVASGSFDNTVRLWDLGTGKARGPALEGHTSTVSCLAISPDGKTVASESLGKTVRLWDIHHRTLPPRIFPPIDLHLTNGFLLFQCDSASCRIVWDLQDGLWSVSHDSPSFVLYKAPCWLSHGQMQIESDGWITSHQGYILLPSAYRPIDDRSFPMLVGGSQAGQRIIVGTREILILDVSECSLF
ncbi:hypothetical protein FRB98_005381, partial [Tulasnella sp. 332]